MLKTNFEIELLSETLHTGLTHQMKYYTEISDQSNKLEVCEMQNCGRFLHRCVVTQRFDGTCNVEDKLRDRVTF